MVNIRGYIAQAKTKFRARQSEKEAEQLQKLADKVNVMEKKAVLQKEALKYEKTAQAYEKAHPSLLKRFGQSVSKMSSRGKKVSPTQRNRALNQFGGYNQGSTGLQFGGSSGGLQFGGSGSPFMESPKKKK